MLCKPDCDLCGNNCLLQFERCSFCHRSLFPFLPVIINRLLMRYWPKSNTGSILHIGCVEKYCRGKEHTAYYWRLRAMEAMKDSSVDPGDEERKED